MPNPLWSGLENALAYFSPLQQPQNPLAAQIMTNPIGTSVSRDPVVAMTPNGPVTASQLAAAHQQVQQAFALAPTMAMGLSGEPIRAFHGSPYDFDAFDVSKIGSGEGAQAYGHGLYFAGNEDIAKGYRDTLTPQKNRDWTDLQYEIANATHAKNRTFSDLMSRGITGETADAALAPHDARLDALYEQEQAMKDAGRSGRMYEVALHTTPEQMLDWDKPLSEQSPQVQRALSKTEWYPYAEQSLERLPDNPTGSDLHRWLRQDLEPNEASEYLRQAGIHGIQYLDAGSRAAGDGTRNYVMFDPNLIRIVRKYAVPAFVSSGAIPAAMGGGKKDN